MRKFPAPPLATDFEVGDRLVALKEQSPKIPVGTTGQVIAVLPVTNEVHILWDIPGGKIAVGSPTHGYEKVSK